MNYGRLMRDPEDARLREWVTNYEQLTDMSAILAGYSQELIHQKRASEDNLARNHPDRV